MREILDKRQENNGLIKRLCEDNLSDEVITRIVSDFVIAAGDTVCFFYVHNLISFMVPT